MMIRIDFSRASRAVLALVVLAVLGWMFDSNAQDQDWVRMWERAQKDRPASIDATGRIAKQSEPGIPLVIHGGVYAADGVTPVAGVIVFAYQTDNEGLYNKPGDSRWRLRGWAKSDVNGRFELRTIRPGSYPGGRNPAHVHFTVTGPDVPRQWASELRFADDPLLDRRERGAAERGGRFTSARPVTTRGGVQHVQFNIRIDNEGRF